MQARHRHVAARSLQVLLGDLHNGRTKMAGLYGLYEELECMRYAVHDDLKLSIRTLMHTLFRHVQLQCSTVSTTPDKLTCARVC